MTMYSRCYFGGEVTTETRRTKVKITVNGKKWNEIMPLCGHKDVSYGEMTKTAQM